MTRIVAVIPARMGSSRFPGKPLAPLCGRPMLEHVYSRTAACPELDEVVVATCDDPIARVAAGFGARVVMTSPSHQRATDRVAEASADDPAEIVVMVQGDEPMIRPEMITAAVAPMQTNPAVGCVNLASPIRSEQELRNPNTIKTALARNGQALYFSREVIPTLHARSFADSLWYKQVCIIAFRRDALRLFASLPEGPLEQAESIDMLRFLENGLPIHMVLTECATHAVDTPADLELVAALMTGEA